MKKIFRFCWPVCKGFLYCGAGLQILLGVAYIAMGFSGAPEFYDTTIYLQMTEHFVVDEYTGLLYPFLVRLAHGVLAQYYYVPIYVLQLAAVFYSVYRFVGVFTRRRVAVFCALWISTIPFVAQAVVTVLPHALAFGCLVWMLAQVLKASMDMTAVSYTGWAIIFIAFTILSQLTRGYLWIGAGIVLWAVILQFREASHRGVKVFLSILISVGILVSNLALYHATEALGYYGRIQKSPEAVFFQRTAAPILQRKFMVYMPQEVNDTFTYEDLEEFCIYPYKLQREMGPILEDAYGVERSREIFVELGKLGLEVAARENLLAFAEDALSYAFPGLAQLTWQSGEVKGATTWNYQQFVECCPTLAVKYLRITMVTWLAGLVLSLAVLFVRAVGSGKSALRMWLPVVVLLGLYGAMLAMRGAGLYDYKMALLPLALGYAPLCCVLFGPQNGEIYEPIQKEPAGLS